MTPGDVVYYRDKTGAHFGYLVTIDGSVARIKIGDDQRTVNAGDVKPWPPPPPDAPTISKTRRK